jgi:PIN domain nuclease of toxin-antitoxin system
MRLLLDTHVLLWTVASSRRLSKEARQLIEDPENDVFYSAASLWEIAIKSSLRRSDFRGGVPCRAPCDRPG